jgi:hypothetical protein
MTHNVCHPIAKLLLGAQGWMIAPFFYYSLFKVFNFSRMFNVTWPCARCSSLKSLFRIVGTLFAKPMLAAFHAVVGVFV